MINLDRILSQLGRYAYGVLAMLLFNAGANAQTDSNLSRLKSFVQNINTFNTLLPQEKVYLHFDNTSYFLGEHIWFKAYVVNPTENRPTAMSRVLYVELLNQQGFVLQTKKFKINDNGQCHGDFALSDSMFAGFYEVRAYTRYMLNFVQDDRWICLMPVSYETSSDWTNVCYLWKPVRGKQITKNAYYNSDNVFTRVFPIYNRPSKRGDYEDKQMRKRSWNPTLTIANQKEYSNRNPTLKTEIPKPAPVELSFFPEGGELIRGVNSRVAFKATDGEGQDLQVEGQIMDQNQKEVTSFKTMQRGMGFFNLCPEDTTTYTARIFYQNTFYSFKLPIIEASGFVLSVNNLTSENFVLVQLDKAGILPDELLGISVLNSGNIVWFDTIQVKNKNQVTIQIDKKLLASGVNQLTVFNVNGRIYADRLFFTSNINHQAIQLNVPQAPKALKPFEQIQLKFNAVDPSNKPVQSGFSLSIRETATTEGTFNTDDIVSNLLLSSELKGYIADPAYYFKSDDIIHRTALDLLMLTQGWRKYSWKKSSGVESFQATEPVEKGLTLNGFIKKREQGKGVKLATNANISLFIALNDSLLLSGNQPTGPGASFHFDLPDLMGKHPAFLEMSDSTQLKKDEPLTKKRTWFNTFLNLIKVKEKTYEKDFANGLNATINRIQLLPKSSFSYYEINPPIAEWKDNEVYTSTGSIARGVTLKAVEVQAKNKDPFRYKKPNLTLPDFSLTGDDLFEACMDGNWPINMNFNNMLNETINLKYHLFVDGYDVFYDLGLEIFRLPTFTPTQMYNIGSVDFFLASGPRLPFEYSFPSAYVYARKKKGGTRPPLENTRRTQIQGYSYLSDFYHPDYSKGVPPQTQDFRRTLYWNPDVQTDSTGKATVTFYNNATCKQLDISAEGITKEGVPFVYK